MVSDRLKQPLLQFVRSAFSRVDYFALYQATVVSQSGSSVDVQPIDSRIPGMKDVPLRLGIPGASVSLSPGKTVLLGWSEGNPAKPYACTFDGSETVLELKFTGTQIKVEGSTVILAGGNLAVARQTDSVTGTAGPYPLTAGTITGGNPAVKA